jgi:hypothetical protein
VLANDRRQKMTLNICCLYRLLQLLMHYIVIYANKFIVFFISNFRHFVNIVSSPTLKMEHTQCSKT